MIPVNVQPSILTSIKLLEFVVNLSVQVGLYGTNISSSVLKSTKCVTHGKSLTSTAKVVKSSAKSTKLTLKSLITVHVLHRDLTMIR